MAFAIPILRRANSGWPENVLTTLVFLFALAGTQRPASAAPGDSNSPATTNRVAPAVRIVAAYQNAGLKFQTETNSADAAWQFGRACYDLAALTNSNSARAALAQEGMTACRRAIKLRPDSAQAHYYLGMNIGELADTKRNLAALRMVRDMEREFLAARDADEHLDHAGPDRNLGLLYEQAPSIISIGSRSRARQHLQRAIDLDPDYPENRLNLIEAFLKWGDKSSAVHELLELQKNWSESQKEFSGDEWKTSWTDWEKRLNEARKKIIGSAR